MSDIVLAILAVISIIISVTVFIKIFIGVCADGDRQRNRRRLGNANQDEDVWNISARVNQQTPGSTANQQSNWPTHDTHIPIDNFVLTHDYTMKDNRPPPPPYSEVGLPSYEQATGCRVPKPDLPIVHEASGSSQGTNPGPSR